MILDGQPGSTGSRFGPAALWDVLVGRMFSCESHLLGLNPLPLTIVRLAHRSVCNTDMWSLQVVVDAAVDGMLIGPSA